jgi:benzoyl-CoA reductase/2-hydroxyglutaryl-CoA dehydratase subunit BcrC/BadD/HgdB
MSSEHGRAFLQVAFMPWVYSRITKTQEFSIYASEVMLVQEVSDYMEDYYWNSMESLTKEPDTKNPDRVEEIKKMLEELGLDGDLDTIKKVYH